MSRVRSAFDAFHWSAAGATGLRASDDYVAQDLADRLAKLEREEGLDAGQERYTFAEAAADVADAPSSVETYSAFVPDDGAPLTNAEGYVLMLPFEAEWGNPRQNQADHDRVIVRIEEIQGMSSRAPWADLVKARDDIESILANLFFWEPGTDMAEVRKELAGRSPEIQEYFAEIRREQPADATYRRSILSTDESVTSTIKDDIRLIVSWARIAVDHLYYLRRKGVQEMLRWHDDAEPDWRISNASVPAGTMHGPDIQQSLDL
jgi:hypothetical protein